MSEGHQEPASVFDFLYLHRDRIASYISQLNEYGHLVRIVGGISDTDETTSKLSAAGLAGISAKEQTQESIQKHYDASWLNALNLLDELHARGAIEKDLFSASLGQVVLLQGNVQILDLTIMKDMWDKKPIQALMKSGVTEGLQGKARQEAISNISFMTEMFKMLPHTVQATISNGQLDAWCILDEAFLTVEPSEIALKHGVDLSGDWAMLAILDARPEENQAPGSTQAAPSPLGTLIRELFPVIKDTMGRPAGYFGVTPILLFREVSQ